MTKYHQQHTRRDPFALSGKLVIHTVVGTEILLASIGSVCAQSPAPSDGLTKEEWLDAFMENKGLGPPLHGKPTPSTAA